MCTGLEIAAFIGAGLSAAAGGMAATQERFADEVTAHQMDLDANAEKVAAEERADRVRRNAKKTRSNARAAYAAGGVDAGEGSAIAIDEQIATDSESDAWQEILYGDRRASRMRGEAAALRRGAKNKATQAYFGIGGSLLSQGAQLSRGGWGSRPRAEQYPAPIEERTIRVNN